jgi:hypothetical protein
MHTAFLAQATVPTPAVNQVFLDLTNLSRIPNPLAPVEDAILAIAYTITVAGFIFHFWANKDNPAPGFSTLLRCLIVVACITMLPLLRNLLQTVFYYIPEQLLSGQSGVNFAGDRLRELVLTNTNQIDLGPLDFLTSGFKSVLNWILATLFSSLPTAASLIVLPFYFVQRFAAMIGFTFMPIALACMTVPALAGKATNYVLSILSVLAWPLGFVLSSVAANSVLDVAALTPPPSTSPLLVLLIGPMVAASVLTIGITSTPLFAYYLFTTGGAQVPAPGGTQMSSAMRSAANIAKSMGGSK